MEAPPDMDETLVESSGPGEGVKKKSRKSASVMPTTYLTPTDARCVSICISLSSLICNFQLFEQRSLERSLE